MRHLLTVPFILAIAGPVVAQTANTAQPPGSAGVSHWKLDDMHVIGSNGQKIGEVEEALIDASGRVSAVAVDVGGVMGVGDKEVVVQLDQLKFDNGRLISTMTKEQLEAQPRWQKR